MLKTFFLPSILNLYIILYYPTPHLSIGIRLLLAITSNVGAKTVAVINSAIDIIAIIISIIVILLHFLHLHHSLLYVLK